MGILAEFYGATARALLPPGRLLSRDPDSTVQGLLLAIGACFEALHTAAVRVLIEELYPPSTIALLPEWERALGLPDACTPIGQTLQERRARVVAKYVLQPRPTLAYLAELATRIGYPDATFEETGPYELTVNVPNPRVTYFRCGASRCGDRLGKIDRAEDLECLLNEEKPAHIALVFDYTGV